MDELSTAGSMNECEDRAVSSSSGRYWSRLREIRSRLNEAASCLESVQDCEL